MLAATRADRRGADGREADVLALFAGGADVNEPQTDGATRCSSPQEGHAEVATFATPT